MHDVHVSYDVYFVALADLCEGSGESWGASVDESGAQDQDVGFADFGPDRTEDGLYLVGFCYGGSVGVDCG